MIAWRRSGARSVRGAGPVRAQLGREAPRRGVAREDVNPAAWIQVPRKLQNEMRRPAEAGETQQRAVLQPGQHERAITDGARRREEGAASTSVNASGMGVGVILAHGHELGVAAVDIAAGGPKRRAQVLVGRPRRRVDPADAHPVADRRACRRPDPCGRPGRPPGVPGDDGQPCGGAVRPSISSSSVWHTPHAADADEDFTPRPGSGAGSSTSSSGV